MNKVKISLIVIVVLLLAFFLLGPYFILEEGQLAVVTRFGKIIKSETEAGLKFKMPFLDTVLKFPKKIQSWDGESQILPTAEKQFIWLDTTARWKITDQKMFYESVGSINKAHSLLDDVIESSVRKVVANNTLRESVRSSNIINTIERKDIFETDTASAEEANEISLIGTETKTKYDNIKLGRVQLADLMLKEALKTTPNYGIILIDIIIRQIKYSDDLTLTVYKQMIKERNQIAQAFRSAGEGEKANWMGKMQKELLSINSEATRKAKEIKAKADAIALEIRNRAYKKDPEFAEFWMAIVEYQKLLPKMKKIITTDFDFFKYLYSKFGK